MSGTTVGRSVPSQKRVNFSMTMGGITLWIMIIVFFLGIIFLFTKLFKNIDIDTQFIKLVMTIEFLARSALININFGHLLFQFFDKIFSFDTWFMWRVIDEKGLRGRLGGRLDEYRVPLLLVNANLIATGIYLISSIINLGSKIIIKKPKNLEQINKKNAIQAIHFLIMGATIQDVIFYGSI
jgi:hypothetical protein